MEDFRVVVCLVLVTLVSTLAQSSDDAVTFTAVPDSVTFNTVESLHSSEVADVLSAMLSYTLKKPYTWQSLNPVNPLKRPEAIFVLHFMGVNPDLPLNIKGTKFPLENLNDLDEQYNLLALRTMNRFGQNADGKPVLVKMDASDELYGPKSEQRMLFKSIPADAAGRLEKAKEDSDLGRTLDEGTFNISNDPDYRFFVELVTVKLLHNALQSNKAIVRDSVPDVYWVQMHALHSIVEEYGTESRQAREAARLVEQLVSESVLSLTNTYDNRAVVMVITEAGLPYVVTRKTRSLLEHNDILANALLHAVHQHRYKSAIPNIVVVKNPNDTSLAYNFQDDFHVAFALTFFTSVFLILTVLGVSVAMWFMDPGRDSIIYRMTSQRKKD